MEKPKKRRGGRIALIVIVVLLALVCAAPFIYNAATHFSYDDYEALAGGSGELFDLSAAADGEHLLFHLDKNSVYRLMVDNALLQEAEAQLGGRVAIERLGYTLRAGADGGSGEAEIRAAAKVLGFLPAQLRALADVTVVDTQTLSVKLREVWYGDRIRISAEKMAQWTGMGELAGGFTISLADWTGPLRADAVRLEGEGLSISSLLLDRVIDEVAAQDVPEELRLLRLYSDDAALTPAFFGGGRADFICAAGSDLAALRTALRDVAACGSESYRSALASELSALPVDLSSELDALSIPALREAQRAQLATGQEYYASCQLDLRNLYWYKNVILTAARLLDASGAPLENALPAELEARVVLMYNENYDAIVKTNEGNPRLQEPLPGLPMMSELPRDSWNALPPEGDGPFDLTLALRLPSGVPAVVFLTAEDDFGLCVISEALFAELRESERLPIRSSAAVVTAPRGSWLRVRALRDDLPDAYYIGLDTPG